MQNEESVMVIDRLIFPVALEALSVQADPAQDAGNATGDPVSLVWAGAVLLVIVLIGLPVLATVVGHKRKADEGAAETPLKGLGLPEGSVRSMLALMTVGTFVVVATFGQRGLGPAYESVLTTLATLAGPVLGFYFGSRGSGGTGNKG
ncbi:hypothetical protein [Candidatus Palauibacter sp.]|uniref:hypothetical protein n=1 Tax=Candidatus Palauibacter sp. TaxID=3101350 RepID=UPI003C703FD1